MDKPFWDPERMLYPKPTPVTEEQVRAWEQSHSVRLPATLAQALRDQNGGCVMGTDMMIEPLQKFSPLSDNQWEHVTLDYDEEGDTDRSKLYHIGVTSTGLGVVLDCTIEPEPRVLFLWHDLGGELRDEGVSTFDQLIEYEQIG